MKIMFISLGCDKNLVDSEMMITDLQKNGFEMTDDEAEAEIIIVNTCCFIGDAKEESINTLLEMARYKEEGRCILLVAAGCLAQRYHNEIRAEIPEVDVIIGTMAYEKLPNLLNQAIADKNKSVFMEDNHKRHIQYDEVKSKDNIKSLHNKKNPGVVEYLEDIDYLPTPLTDRNSTSGGYYAYLKIAEGCDKCCTYCVIPKVRGRYRSVALENLVAQAEHLASNGAKELILVAQETTLYGTDLYGKKSLPLLLEKLSEVEGIRWIRILYCYPEEITPDLVEAMKRLPKVCHYLDIPVQHGSDSILKRMGRKTDQEQLKRVIGMLREKIPDIVLRTTLITGFPGETQEDFESLREFVKEMRFERLGVFPYSQEEETPAADMPDQVEDQVKEQRRDEIMALQQEIAFEHSASRVGRTYDVMVEGYLPEDGVYIGRTYMDAPDVDGYVFFETDWSLMSGDFVRVKITEAKGYDLAGEIEEDNDEFTE